jgi:hypothetical protein
MPAVEPSRLNARCTQNSAAFHATNHQTGDLKMAANRTWGRSVKQRYYTNLHRALAFHDTARRHALGERTAHIPAGCWCTTGSTEKTFTLKNTDKSALWDQNGA